MNPRHTAHPWHGVDHGWNPPSVQGVIEIPQGSRIKYEMDKDSGLIRMDRLLSSSFEYPVNYGFIPRTLGPDGDPLDILVLTHSPVVPLTLIRCRVIGIMQMTDREVSDDKILAVAENDATVRHIRKLEDLPPHFFDELRNFFEEYKKLENKKTTIGKFEDVRHASEVIERHITLYENEAGQAIPEG